MSDTFVAKVLHANPAREYYFKEGCHILELSNDADDPALSIARARVAPGKTTQPHRLMGVTERYVIQKGRGLVIIDGQRTQVEQGSVVRIPPGVSQCIHNTGSGDLIFLALCTPRFTPECYEALSSD